MLWAFVRKPSLTQFVSLLYPFDYVDKVADRCLIGVERHHDTTNDSIHLCPLHPFGGLQCTLHVTGNQLFACLVNALNLDLRSSFAHPGSTVLSIADESIQEPSHRLWQIEWIHPRYSQFPPKGTRFEIPGTTLRNSERLGSGPRFPPFDESLHNEPNCNSQSLNEQGFKNDVHSHPSDSRTRS
jgi:hypothetical protein